MSTCIIRYSSADNARCLKLFEFAGRARQALRTGECGLNLSRLGVALLKPYNDSTLAYFGNAWIGT